MIKYTFIQSKTFIVYNYWHIWEMVECLLFALCQKEIAKTFQIPCQSLHGEQIHIALYLDTTGNSPAYQHLQEISSIHHV